MAAIDNANPVRGRVLRDMLCSFNYYYGCFILRILGYFAPDILRGLNQLLGRALFFVYWYVYGTFIWLLPWNMGLALNAFLGWILVELPLAITVYCLWKLWSMLERRRVSYTIRNWVVVVTVVMMLVCFADGGWAGKELAVHYFFKPSRSSTSSRVASELRTALAPRSTIWRGISTPTRSYAPPPRVSKLVSAWQAVTSYTVQVLGELCLIPFYFALSDAAVGRDLHALLTLQFAYCSVLLKRYPRVALLLPLMPIVEIFVAPSLWLRFALLRDAGFTPLLECLGVYAVMVWAGIVVVWALHGGVGRPVPPRDTWPRGLLYWLCLMQWVAAHGVLAMYWLREALLALPGRLHRVVDYLNSWVFAD